MKACEVGVNHGLNLRLFQVICQFINDRCVLLKYRRKGKTEMCNFVCLYAGGTDILYNKFNVKSWVPPENPPRNANSNFKCVVATTTEYWRLSKCWDKHRVVCQSG